MFDYCAKAILYGSILFAMIAKRLTPYSKHAVAALAQELQVYTNIKDSRAHFCVTHAFHHRGILPGSYTIQYM